MSDPFPPLAPPAPRDELASKALARAKDQLRERQLKTLHRKRDEWLIEIERLKACINGISSAIDIVEGVT